MRASLVVGVLGCVLLAGSSVTAQVPTMPVGRAATPVADPQAIARGHFQRGIEHFRAHRFREAIREFELSAAQVPSAELWFDIARSHEQLGECELAVENYRRYLRDRVDAPDAREIEARITALEARASAAKTSAAERARRPSAIAIDAPARGARLVLDGRELGTTPVERLVEVDPGVHRIEASRAGFIPFRAEVDVAPGGLSAAIVELQPTHEIAARRSSSALPWVVAATAAAALLSSGALGLAALHARDDGDFGGARRWARASDATFGGALVLSIAALVIYESEAHRSYASTP